MDELNNKISVDNFKIDFDLIVKEKSDVIFSKREKDVLNKRILMCAYLKYLAACNNESNLLYSLYFDENQKNKLMENMLKKGIYEYYVALKFKYREENKMTNIFALKNKSKEKKLSSKQINSVISIIESLWVNNA